MTDSLTSATPGSLSTAPRTVAAQLGQSIPPTFQLMGVVLLTAAFVMAFSFARIILLPYTTSSRYRFKGVAMERILSIGHLGRLANCKVETIRYYERAGLMPEPDRSMGNQRRYHKAHLDRLTFIRHARELGFTVEQIRELLNLSAKPDRSCVDIDEIARRHLDEVRAKISRLTSLESELVRITQSCAGGKVCDCAIIEALADHSRCIYEQH